MCGPLRNETTREAIALPHRKGSWNAPETGGGETRPVSGAGARVRGVPPHRRPQILCTGDTLSGPRRASQGDLRAHLAGAYPPGTLCQPGAERLTWGKRNEASREGPWWRHLLSLDACAPLRVSSVNGSFEREL